MNPNTRVQIPAHTDRWMKRLLTTVALTASIVLAGNVVVNASGGSSETLAAQDHTITRGGVIRIGSSVYLHTNAAHAAIGIRKITLINNCQLRVYFDYNRGERVVSAIADEDENISRLDVQAGVSNGVDAANIYLWHNGRRVCANDRRFGSHKANIWLNVVYLKNWS